MLYSRERLLKRRLFFSSIVRAPVVLKQNYECHFHIPKHSNSMDYNIEGWLKLYSMYNLKSSDEDVYYCAEKLQEEFCRLDRLQIPLTHCHWLSHTGSCRILHTLHSEIIWVEKPYCERGTCMLSFSTNISNKLDSFFGGIREGETILRPWKFTMALRVFNIDSKWSIKVSQ